MTTTQLAFRRCAAAAFAFALLGAAIAWIGEAATGSSSPWLHIAAFLPSAAACFAAVTFWPMFHADADGRELIRRTTRGPLHGMAAVALAAGIAGALSLCALGAICAPLVPEPRSHIAMEPLTRPLLDGRKGAEARFAVGRACEELRLRPAALLPNDSPEATRVTVLIDDKEATSEPIAFAGHRQLAVIPVRGQRIESITLRATSGNVPLLFDREGAIAVDAAAHSRALGAAIALLVGALPLLVALTIAMLTAPHCALGVQLALAFVALLVQTAGQAGPTDAAVTLCARGRWVAAEGLGASCAASVGVAAIAIALAALLRKERA